MDSNRVDNDDLLLAKYLGTAEKCEQLAKRFLAEEDIQLVFNEYNDCLMAVQELITFESTSEHLKALDSVKCQLMWQQQQLQDAIACGATVSSQAPSPSNPGQSNCKNPPNKKPKRKYL